MSQLQGRKGGLGVSASKMPIGQMCRGGVVCVEKSTHKDAGGDEGGRWKIEKLLTFEQGRMGQSRG